MKVMLILLVSGAASCILGSLASIFTCGDYTSVGLAKISLIIGHVGYAVMAIPAIFFSIKLTVDRANIIPIPCALLALVAFFLLLRYCRSEYNLSGYYRDNAKWYR